MSDTGRCDPGRLAAYRDGALDDDAYSACEEHLAGCHACREDLALLRARAASIALHLDALVPGRLPDGHLSAARARLASRAAPPTHPEPQRSWPMFGVPSRATTARAALPLAAAAALVVLLAATPVRRAAADFLAVFRVHEITVVKVGPTDSPDLGALEALADSGAFGEPEFLRRPTEPRTVPDLTTAAERAGFAVRAIQGLDGSLDAAVSPGAIQVATGPHLAFQLDRQTIGLALTALGVTDVDLPQVPAFDVEIDVPTMVAQDYRIEEADIQLVQIPSPTVTFPPDLPIDDLGMLYLRAIGMDAESAVRTAAGIDWTSTLVLPLPTDQARYQDVTVSGRPAILITTAWSPDRAQKIALVWQDDGIVLALLGADVTASLLMRAAEALR